MKLRDELPWRWVRSQAGSEIRHVEHELVAALQHEDALVVRRPALHPRRARHGQRHRETDLSARRLALLDHPLVDVLAERMDARGGELGQRTLHGTGRNLAVGLPPAVHRSGVQMHVVEAVCSGVHEIPGQGVPIAGIWRPVTK